MIENYMQYLQAKKHLEIIEYDIMELSDDILLDYLKDNNFQELLKAVVSVNNYGQEYIDRWKLTEVHNNWVELNK